MLEDRYPFNPDTWILRQLVADVTLTIYDLRGVMVRGWNWGIVRPPEFYYTEPVRRIGTDEMPSVKR